MFNNLKFLFLPILHFITQLSWQNNKVNTIIFQTSDKITINKEEVPYTSKQFHLLFVHQLII